MCDVNCNINLYYNLFEVGIFRLWFRFYFDVCMAISYIGFVCEHALFNGFIINHEIMLWKIF